MRVLVLAVLVLHVAASPDTFPVTFAFVTGKLQGNQRNGIWPKTDDVTVGANNYCQQW